MLGCGTIPVCTQSVQVLSTAPLLRKRRTCRCSSGFPRYLSKATLFVGYDGLQTSLALSGGKMQPHCRIWRLKGTMQSLCFCLAWRQEWILIYIPMLFCFTHLSSQRLGDLSVTATQHHQRTHESRKSSLFLSEA